MTDKLYMPIISLLCIIMFLVGASFSSKKKAVTRTIADYEQQAEWLNEHNMLIKEHLPTLQLKAASVLQQESAHFAPPENAVNWAIERASMPKTPDGFERSFGMVRNNRKGSESQFALRHLDRKIYPLLEPVSILVEFSGSLDQAAAYFEELSWMNPCSVITELEVREVTTNTLFEGKAVVTFPKIMHAEELGLIQELAAEMLTTNTPAEQQIAEDHRAPLNPSADAL